MNSTLKTLLVILLFAPFASFAQLSGSYTIGGTSPDYSTISAAISALNSSGINGPTTFNIASGTYPEKLIIGPVTGVSNTNQITFQSASQDSSTVIITALSSASGTANYTVLLNGCSYINLKHLTIERTGQSAYARVIDMQSSVSRIHIENCQIKGDQVSSTSGFTSLVHSQNTNSNKPSHIYLQYNKFINGSYAISIQGITASAGNYATNVVITNNILTGQYRTGIYLAYQDGPLINHNKITSTSGYYNYRAIDLFYTDNDFEIIANDIEINKTHAMSISNSFGSNVTYGLIENNFISCAGASGIGVEIQNSGYINMYFNSINMYGNNAIAFEVGGASTVSLRIMNNIFANQNNNYTIYINTSANNPFTYCNNNNLYSGSTSSFAFFKNSGNVGSLTAWKMASGQGANSISVDPVFISNTDLRINYSGVSEKGSYLMNLPYHTSDYYGYPRNQSQPDIGAFEFSRPNIDVRAHGMGITHCKGDNESLKITIINQGNTILNSNLNASYKLGSGTPITATINPNGLISGDSLIYTFGQKVTFSSVGTFDLATRVVLDNDIDTTNNTDSLMQFVVNDKPFVDLGSNYYQCASDTTMLNAGSGFDTYMWNTGENTQIIVADTNGIGLGGHYFKVTIGKNNCYSSDSVLIFFQDCTGIDKIENKLEVEVYPNPSTEILYLNCDEPFTLKMYNSNGQLVLEKMISRGHNMLDISNFSKGFYFLYMKSKEHVGVQKLQVN